TTLNAALAEATAERIAAESALRAKATSAETRAASGQLQNMLAAAEAKLASLRANFGPGYPEVQAAQSEVGALHEALASSPGREVSTLEAAYRQARNEEVNLQTQV